MGIVEAGMQLDNQGKLDDFIGQYREKSSSLSYLLSSLLQFFPPGAEKPEKGIDISIACIEINVCSENVYASVHGPLHFFAGELRDAMEVKALAE